MSSIKKANYEMYTPKRSVMSAMFFYIAISTCNVFLKKSGYKLL